MPRPVLDPERVYLVIRPTQEERDLILDAKGDDETMYEMFQRIESFIEDADPELPQRRPMRLSLPSTILDALRARAEETGRPITRILLEAIELSESE